MKRSNQQAFAGDESDSSDQILFEDGDFPMKDSDDDCLSETSQIFVENSIDLENYFSDSGDELLSESSQIFLENPFALPLYYQVGSGYEIRPSLSTRGLALVEGYNSEDLGNAVIIEERARRRNRRYNAEEITFRARVDIDQLPAGLQQNTLVAAVECVRQLIQLLINRCTQSLRPDDLIRFCMQSPGLDKPISTSLMTVSSVTVEKILSTIMRVLQSKDEIRLDDGFMIDVITIRRDVGGGLNRRVVNIDVDRLQKRSVLSVPPDEEGLCCAKSIVIALAHLENDRKAINAIKKPERPALIKRAKALHEDAGVRLGPCTYTEIGVFENWLDVQIVVISAENLNTVSYKGKNRPRRINLWLHNEHYDVIKSLKGFYGTDHYCESCEKPYKNMEDHSCDNVCPVCFRIECTPGQPQRCNDCDRLCRSVECFESHKATPGRRQFSMCDKLYQCRDCCQVILRRHCPMNLHRCGTTKCPSCKQYVVAAEHHCFLQNVDPKKHCERLIFFDFETDQSTGEHNVNLAIAQYVNGDEHIFKGYDACKKFCSWLFSPTHKGYTAIAHNMKGFDGQFIMSWMLSQGIAPDVIPNGSKVMAITHSSLNIKVIDSFNFLPMALSKLPGCFGMDELKKGYFPHLFNTRQHQTYIGSFPDIGFFNADSMTANARTAFLEWYESQKEQIFNFEEEIINYCRSDVDILRRCCLEFRKQFIEIADVDPFCYITIASACMATYRAKHLKKDTVAMVPVRGYINNTNFSPDSIRWLDFIAAREDKIVQHALNHTGEFKIDGISVDGFCLETNTIYQFHGCFFHGCSVCFEKDCRNPLLGVSMGTLHQKTEISTSKLKEKGYRVVEKWEHDFKREKKHDADLQLFLQSHDLKDRLNPRDAFFGGRTNAIKLYFEGNAKYVDFTSLYPWVNKYCRYPVGHPEIITEDFQEVENYFGAIHCRVLPPRKLHLPVLPYRCNGKLMFPLCQSCAEEINQTPCQHSDDKRSITGTWVTEEVKLAVEKGYKVTKIYEIYHFPESSSSLFKSYIDLFLKIKQESSGFPTGCNSQEDRQRYVKEYYEREGVELNPLDICKNPGRRQVAKLALNSFWGRWGMNTNKSRLSYVHTLPDFNKLLSDSTKNIKDIYLPSPEVAAIIWDSKQEFIEQDTATNVFLAAFTTAWARLKLYSEMDKLGTAVLYHDTDSIIYSSVGTNDPPLGNFLGDFTDELDGDIITTFISGGPKNYGYKTKSGKTCCKVRGFTLNFRNAQRLNFDSMAHLICNMDRDSTIIIRDPSKITRDGKKRKVFNKEEVKLYRIVYDKRVICEDYSTLPFGY